MAFGAIYVGQLAVQTMQCCLRRLQVPSQSLEEDNCRRLHGEAETGGEDLIRLKRGKGSSSSQRGSTSVNITIQSGLQHDDGLAISPMPSSSYSTSPIEHGAVSSATTHATGAASRRSTSSSGFACAAGSSCHDRAAGATSRTSASSSGLAGAVGASSTDLGSQRYIKNLCFKFGLCERCWTEGGSSISEKGDGSDQSMESIPARICWTGFLKADPF